MKVQPKLNALFFLLLIFGFGIINLIHAPSRNVSSLEQRELAQKPAFSLSRFFTGEFTQEFDDYFSDRFAFRTFMVKAGAFLTELKGLPDTDEATIVQQGGDNTAQKLNADSSTGAAANTGQETRYLLYKDRAYTLFNYSASAAEMYAEALNRFKASVDPEVHVYSLLAPTSAEFIEPEKYKELSDSQKAAFGHIDELLDSGIGRIDAYGALERHSGEEVYFRTDHHWTALGAYYAYVELMDALGEEGVPLSSYSTGEIEGFLGSSYKATLSFKLKAHPDTITYYEPFANYTYTRYLTTGKAVKGNVVDPDFANANNGLYAVFLGGDFPWGEIETGQQNGKKIAVIKDSYGNALIPFLIPHYETVYYIDPRYFSGSLTDFVEEHGVTDVLFLNSSTAARTTGMAQLINGLMGNAK